MTDSPAEYVPGLEGIPAARSAISFVDGQAGRLEYRGIPIETLAERSSFEETAWLLYEGRLPNRVELEHFRAELAAARALPEALESWVRSLPTTAHPMTALQAALAGLGAHSEPVSLRDAQSCRRAWVRILGATPSLVAAFHRARLGQPPVPPRPDADHATHFLLALSGKEPDPFLAHVLDVALVLHADHTLNASTFTARVVASTESDPYSVCASAIGALKGPLHGGANERVLAQLREIGSPEGAAAWLDARLAAKAKVMGFGHRVYKTKDPRAKILQSLARQLFERRGTTPLYDIALALEAAVTGRLGEKGIYPNVDFFSGLVYEKLGIPTDLFTPVFGIARVAGYLAHWHEQMQDNRIFRPRQIYVGEHDRPFVPFEER